MLWKLPGILGSNLLAVGHSSIKQSQHQTVYTLYIGKETKSSSSRTFHQENIIHQENIHSSRRHQEDNTT